ncbi:MAG: succinate dehydrogenase cytochrome b subunit [Bdellovibrionales bacterium]|nr:succinate dehydrogenase cytochrome b subunit [Bdellovibrionales bacterium]
MNFLKSTIGRKQLVGLAGLALAGFVFAHMLGNLLILVSPRAYNEYGHALVSNPLIYIAEAGLVAFFVVHVILAVVLTLRNRNSREVKYAMAASGDKKTSLVKKSLWAQGMILLIFVVLHIITFKYGEFYSVNYGNGEIRDLHRLVVEVFQLPGYVVWYVISLVLLGYHLSHGVASSFQTLGLSHPKYTPKIKLGSLLFALVVSAGFIIQPIYVYLLM